MSFIKNTITVVWPDVNESLMHGNPVPGLDVFITATKKDGSRKTVPALLNPLGRVVYGASLDPDAEDVYEVADTEVGQCQTLLGELSGEFEHFRVWRNGLNNDIIVLQDWDVDGGIAITNTETMTFEFPIPFGEDDNVFHGGRLR